MPPSVMHGVSSVRIGVYRTHMSQGKRHGVKFLDIIAPWPLSDQNDTEIDGQKVAGPIGYGPDLSDGFGEVFEYSGTYEFVDSGEFRFNLPTGVTGHGVKQFGSSGVVTLFGIHPSSHKGSTGIAEIRGAGVDYPSGVRWKIEIGYKNPGDL